METLHPLVSVDFSTLKSLKHGRKFWLYCVFLKQLKCGELSYGRSTSDYHREGTLVFVAPQDKWQELMMTENH